MIGRLVNQYVVVLSTTKDPIHPPSDDQVEEGNLSNGLDITSKAWQVSIISMTFSQWIISLSKPLEDSVRGSLYVLWMSSAGEYAVTNSGKPVILIINCINQEATVGQRLARAGSVILPSRNRMEPPVDRDDCYSATHPSEHNSVYIIDRSGPTRDVREAEWRRRREKEGEKVGKGTRRSKNTGLEERYMRGRIHDFPFTMPVPTTCGYGWPCVQLRHAAGCAAVRPCAMFRFIL